MVVRPLTRAQRDFVEKYVRVGELEKIPERYPRLTLEECERFWSNPRVRAECKERFLQQHEANAVQAARASMVTPDLVRARIVESVKRAEPGALDLALIVTGVMTREDLRKSRAVGRRF